MRGGSGVIECRSEKTGLHEGASHAEVLVFAAEPWRRGRGGRGEAFPPPDAGEWRERFQANPADMGGRLGAGRVALPDPAPDGPFVEVKELVGGYMVVAAASLDEAVAIARACPGPARPGPGVEAIETHAPG